ncbi:hypothetical protein B0H19DRAFT_1065144 [Mycena capillaripes]|nr:hypothetical protein B0H19DRAFT_1065144 [Mycena capillaripes]
MACDCLACNTDTIFEVKFDRRLEVAARGHESVESPPGSLYYKGPIFASRDLAQFRFIVPSGNPILGSTTYPHTAAQPASDKYHRGYESKAVPHKTHIPMPFTGAREGKTIHCFRTFSALPVKLVPMNNETPESADRETSEEDNKRGAKADNQRED